MSEFRNESASSSEDYVHQLLDEIVQEAGSYDFGCIKRKVGELGIDPTKKYSLGIYLEEGWYRGVSMPWHVSAREEKILSQRFIFNRISKCGMEIDDFMICYQSQSIMHLASNALPNEEGTGWRLDGDIGPLLFMRNDEVKIHFGKNYLEGRFGTGTLYPLDMLAMDKLQSDLGLFTPSCVDEISELSYYQH